MEKTCKNCGRALLRGSYSHSRYGSDWCSFECCLEENERMPYRKSDDTCDKWLEKGE